jgi:hypothetical protein
MKHSIGITVPAASETTIFTVPQGYVVDLSLLFLSNHTAGNKTVSVWWEHEHDPTHDIYIVYQKSLNAKDFLQFSDASVVMQQGDSLKIITESGSDFTVIVTFDLRKEKPIYAFPDS